MKISDETKVGILAAFGITILIIGYSFLKGNNLFVKKKFYYALYTKVDGLNQSDPVTLNGYRVGKVDKLELLDNGRGTIVARFSMDKDVRIPRNSVARLISSDLLGEKAIELDLGDSQEFAVEGDTLVGDVEASLQEGVSEQLLPIKNKMEDLFSSVDSILVVFQAILSGGKIESTISKLQLAMDKFANLAVSLDSLVINESDDIGSILDNVDSITANIAQNDENITKLLSNLASITDTLDKADLSATIEGLNATLDQLSTTLKSINEGDGTVSKLINTPELHDSITKLISDLDMLLLDVQENPKRYVNFSLFGGGGGGKDKSSKKDKEQQKEETLN